MTLSEKIAEMREKQGGKLNTACRVHFYGYTVGVEVERTFEGNLQRCWRGLRSLMGERSFRAAGGYDEQEFVDYAYLESYRSY